MTKQDVLSNQLEDGFLSADSKWVWKHPQWKNYGQRPEAQLIKRGGNQTVEWNKIKHIKFLVEWSLKPQRIASITVLILVLSQCFIIIWIVLYK